MSYGQIADDMLGDIVSPMSPLGRKSEALWGCFRQELEFFGLNSGKIQAPPST